MSDRVAMTLYMGPASRYAKGGLAHAAAKVGKAGRYGDTRVIHVNEEEYNHLRRTWGEPTINPRTKLPEYWNVGNLLKYAVPVAAAVFGGDVGSSIFGDTLFGSEALPAIAGAAGLGGAGALLTGQNPLKTAGLSALGAAALPYVTNAIGYTQGAPTLTGGAAKAAASAAPIVKEGALTSLLEDAPASAPSLASVAGDTPLLNGADSLSSTSTLLNGGKELASSGMTGTGESFLSKYKFPLLVGAGSLALKAASNESGDTPAAPHTSNIDNTPLQRERLLSAPITQDADWYKFGTRRKTPIKPGGGYFFDDVNSFAPVDEPVNAAHGGALATLQGSVHRGGDEGFVSQRTPQSDGRSDDIPAMLSPNEFVQDAETTTLLGDGDPAAGSRKWEEMRQIIRKTKGKALAKGKFSPKAPGALDLLRKVGVK